MDQNPYAAPPPDRRPEDRGTFWLEGDAVCCEGKIELPPHCVRSGASAGVVRMRAILPAPWWLGIVPLWAAAHLEVIYYIAPAIRRTRGRKFLAGLVLGVGGGIASLLLSTMLRAPLGIAVGLLLLATGLVVSAAYEQPLRATRRGALFRLTGFSPAFLSQLREGAPQPRTRG